MTQIRLIPPSVWDNLQSIEVELGDDMVNVVTEGGANRLIRDDHTSVVVQALVPGMIDQQSPNVGDVLTVSANDGPANTTYQWKVDGTPISGGIYATLDTTGLPGGIYTREASAGAQATVETPGVMVAAPPVQGSILSVETFANTGGVGPAGLPGDMLVLLYSSEGASGDVPMSSDGIDPIETDVAKLREQSDNNTSQIFWVKLTEATTGLTFTTGRPGGAAGNIRRCTVVNIGPHDFVDGDTNVAAGSGTRSFPTLSNVPAYSLNFYFHAVRGGASDSAIQGPYGITRDPILPSVEGEYYAWNAYMWSVFAQGTVAGDSPDVDHYMTGYNNTRGGHTAAFVPTGAAGQGALPGQYIADDNGAGLAPSSTLSSFDIEDATFTATEDVDVGHYLTGNIGLGDLWVKPRGASTTVTLDYVPAYGAMADGRQGNGAMLNVMSMNSNSTQGFDQNDINSIDWSAAAVTQGPITMSPGDVLVVAKSRDNASGTASIRRFMFIHCVDTVPFDDEFAPPYIWDSSLGARPRFRYSDISEAGIPSLSTDGFDKSIPALTNIEPDFRRRLFDPVGYWERYSLKADGGGATYGRDYQADTDRACAVMVCDIPIEQKRVIIRSLVQRGIDAYGAIRSAYAQGFSEWMAPDGGHNGGRKSLIVIAGHLLGDATMRDWVRDNTSPTAATAMQEDGMRAYLTPAVIAETQQPGWQGAGKKEGGTHNPYETAMGQAPAVPEWIGGTPIGGSIPGFQVNNLWNSNANFYRLVGHTERASGQTVALLAMGLRTTWNQEAFFDYHARYFALDAWGDDPWRYVNGDPMPRYSLMPDVPSGRNGQPSDFAQEMYKVHAFEGSLYTLPAGVNAFHGAN